MFGRIIKAMEIKRLFELLPTAYRMSEDQLTLAITRAAIAHVMNGGKWHGWLGTAISYLETI